MGILSAVLFVFNIIFWVIGGTMLGVGIWLAVDPNAFSLLSITSSAGMDDALWSVSVYIVIGVGAFVFLMGFLGCYGACTMNSVMLLIYSVIVGITILAEIVAVILVAVFYSSITSEIAEGMKRDVQINYVDEESDEGISSAWNSMQGEWKCCGSYGYADYDKSNYQYTTNNSVPWTCCVMKEGTSPSKATKDDVENLTQCRADAKGGAEASKYLHVQGCYTAMEQFFNDNAPILIGVVCGFAALQLIGLLFACLLRRQKEHQMNYA